MGIKIESDCLWPQAGITPHRDVVFEAYCRALGVTDPDPADPARHCRGMFQLSLEALEAFVESGSFHDRLPDVRVHRIEVDAEVGVVTCYATCPRFAALRPEERPRFYEFEFELGLDGSVASKVVQR